MSKNKETEATGILVAAAKTVGATAGTIAAVVGVAKPKTPKLASTNKSRLPRRQKKAAKKALKKSA